MASNDHAIVVGINDYPGMDATSSHRRDLQGPINDAKAIHDWLIDPLKGAVPKGNAKLICSPRPLPPIFDVGNAKPIADEISQEFERLAALATASNPPPIGRRLYVYMSGHGFAPERAKGAIYVANATSGVPRHIFATAYLNWLYEAAYFQELVLWLDCCMTFHFTVVPQAPTLAIVQGSSAGMRVFSAYSARFKQQSVEAPMPDGLVHGVFTYTLLQALDSAVDDYGNVTTASLKQYLINRMKDSVPSQYKQTEIIAKEPDFGFDDQMVFVKGDPFKVKQAVLTGLPDGTQVDILGGKPFGIVASAVVQQEKVALPLRHGLYVARVVGGTTCIPFDL